MITNIINDLNKYIDVDAKELFASLVQKRLDLALKSYYRDMSTVSDIAFAELKRKSLKTISKTLEDI